MTSARRRLLAAALALAASAVACSGCRRAGADPGPADPPPGDPPVAVGGSSWAEVDRLIGEQKLAEAAKRLESLEAGARARRDDAELARVLIRQTQLGIALGGYETAVESLRAEAWPEAPLARAAVELYDAHALAQYLAAYGWEIQQRERVVSGEKLDLKLWTRDQIADEADRAFARVWALRESLGGVAADDFESLHPNDYPKGIRPTLRDAVSYLWADRLADTSHWSPEESAETWKLDLAALADGRGVEPTAERLAGAELHPLARLAAILGDLERWHRGRGETGAALEARLERIGHLHDGLSAEEDREKLRAALERSLPEFRRDEWWSMGMARLAGLTRQSPAPAALVRARELALEGERAYPGTPGAQACRHERESVEAPWFSLQTMSVDAAARRSVQITHRNLPRLHFRAFRIDPEPFGTRPVEWRGWNDDRTRAMLRRTPAASWTQELPATADYRDHRTFATPTLPGSGGSGGYLIVASADAGFGGSNNRLEAVEMAISDLVVLRDPAFGQSPTSDVVRAVSGAGGAPIPGAEATLWRWQWEQKPELVERTATDAEGLARFRKLRDDGQGRGIAVVVRHGGDEAVWSQSWWWGRGQRPGETTSGTLLFTDRAIYRPGQKLFWKAVVWQGEPSAGRLRAAQQAVTVQLYDPNGEVVATANGTTNKFGSASGELEIPTGRLLGSWRLVSGNGSAAIGVEEYKRPTFEVAFEAPAGEPRLNRPVEMTGEAKYYFGLPVASGRVAWRVVREPIWEWGWRWWGWTPAPPRTIASGTAELDADGKFRVKFTAEADERERQGCACFRFTVEAEVTDDGGETRSGTRSVALGWVGVTLAVDGQPFLVDLDADDATSPSWTVRRRDLDGEPRTGASAWRIVALEQPARALLPAELPERVAEDAERYATPGDRLRPRWSEAPPSEQILAGWSADREIARGELVHAAGGEATLTLPALEPGAYRLLAETQDAHGETFTLEQSFAVVGERAELALPLELRFADPVVEVGGTARLLVHSALPGQTIVVELVRGAEVRERRTLVAGREPSWIELPVDSDDRGGFGARAAVVSDHQLVERTAAVAVPWTDRGLTIELGSFRDKLAPGATETFRVTVKDANGRPLEAGGAELVASMYDRSLDLFRPHGVPLVSSLYPSFGAPAGLAGNLGTGGAVWQSTESWYDLTLPPSFTPDSYVAIDPYGIGGPGVGGGRHLARGAVAMDAAMPAPASAPMVQEQVALKAEPEARQRSDARREADAPPPPPPPATPVAVRTDFSETAFWQPHLVTGADGSASIEFRVPESLTSWKLWVAAATRDLAGGYLEREVETVKDLMVRPYLPRFLREGDTASLKVVVNNAAEKPLAGDLRLAIVDAETDEDVSAEFGLPARGATARFSTQPGKGADLSFDVVAPRGVRTVAFRVEARAGGVSDGELRPLPILPSRVRLAQSRFAALTGGERRELVFEDLLADDPTRIDERLVVTVDGQLFYGMLDALPYLVDYPYECTEQTMNRFVSTGVLSSLFDRYPAVGEMAKQLAERETRYERFDSADPNRRMALEETPWLRQSRGGDPSMGGDSDLALLRVLDPGVARAVRTEALGKLQKAQLPSGAFPWFPGGPPSPYMTLYLMYGFARAAEFEVEVPKDTVVRGWRYLASEIERDWWREAIANDCCWELLTFANYIASSYPDPSWMGDVLPEKFRRQILDFSFKHWKQHSPQLKLQLAITLKRMGRPKDAELVLASVMDSAKSDRDLGVYWAAEDRAWLWYNDTIETHAWALRALMEIAPEDRRKEGLVQWLFLNKKLGHWKSTRATAEVLHSLALYLDRQELLGRREEIAVALGGRTTSFVFEPDKFTGKKNQIVLEGEEIVPQRDARIVVEQKTPGFAFASATWHFSTEQLPPAARGDLFAVERRWFRRVKQGKETTLEPLAEGARIAVGDELEIQLSVSARAAAEYVHLRDPRPAGLEPDRSDSGWRWDLGLAYYEETRDSGTNFFFEWVPAGEYTLKYRLRANVAGTFRAAPAQLQSMYAPEFTAYSAGAKLKIER